MKRIVWTSITTAIATVGGGTALFISSLTPSTINPIGSFMLPSPPCDSLSQGFTCTGLSYNTSDGKWYVGNVGAREDSSDFISSIEIIDKDFKRIERKIDLSVIFPEMIDVQGVEVDTASQTIWLCSFNEDKVHHIDFQGNILGSIDIKRPTGIAFDNSTEHLYILTTTHLVESDQCGKTLRNTPLGVPAQDQMVKYGDYIFITSGNDYKHDQFLNIFDLKTNRIVRQVRLAESYAVEGIEIIGDTVYIANDGEYHSSKDGNNVVNVYNLRSLLKEE